MYTFLTCAALAVADDPRLNPRPAGAPAPTMPAGAAAALAAARSVRVSNALAASVWECFRRTGGRRDHGDCVFAWLATTMAPGGVVEVGCHDGRQALEAAAAGHIVATHEPDPQNYAASLRRIEASPHRRAVSIARLALSDSPGTLQIASQGSDSHLVGGGTRPGWNAGSASDTAATTVNVTTVDALVRAGRLLPDTPPLVLKVDTQGFDGKVLFGATDALRDARWPFIMAEHWPIASKRRARANAAPQLYLLAAAGYDLYNLNYLDNVNSAAGLVGSVTLRDAPRHFNSPDDGATVFADDLGTFCTRKRPGLHPMGCSLDLLAVHRSVALDVVSSFGAWAKSAGPMRDLE